MWIIIIAESVQNCKKYLRNQLNFLNIGGGNWNITGKTVYIYDIYIYREREIDIT